MATTSFSFSHDEISAEDISAIYERHPLANSNDTRVLEILPSNSQDLSDIISCRLSVISLDPPPEYRAVSYVWGDPNVNRTILVDGKSFIVRLNIWNFLMQMREDGDRDALWIDAICINQQDLKERGHQVAVMGQIYSKAAEVRVWLGIDPMPLESMTDVDWPMLSFGPIQKQSITSKLYRRRQKRELRKLTGELLEMIAKLRRNEYWSRIWVVQEYAMARRAVIQCGPNMILGDWLACIVEAVRLSLVGLTNLGMKYVSEEHSISKLLSFHTGKVVETAQVYAKRVSSPGLPPTFAKLIWDFKEAKCTDVRDHIYALLSLDGPASEKIIPDYTKSATQLFLDVAVYFRSAYDKEGFPDRALYYQGVKAMPEILGLDIDHPDVKKELDYFYSGLKLPW